MCGECNWVDQVAEGVQVFRNCDCGSSKWVRVALNPQLLEVLDKEIVKALFRCVKCDALYLVRHKERE